MWGCSMNLWQVAQFLKEQGVVNAINLDGGGSSTYVINGTLTSYPSDQWYVKPFFLNNNLNVLKRYYLVKSM